MKSEINRKTNKLEKNISEILVVNDKDLSPFIEIINVSPENITQKPLGTLLGFFEIKDDDKDSAYIVNFLSSVIKKEYFSNPKRTPIDSFESALHKVNLALSEIAKHNNISWIGKLDVALCVITETQIHFSVTGEAKVFLVRNNRMVEISEGLASENAVENPLKTFVDISSGRLRNDDKIIVTSEDIFHVLSEKEIEQGVNSFSNKKFVQFIQTALINELSIAGTIVIEMKETEEVPVIRKVKQPVIAKSNPTATEIPNAFSQTAWVKPEPKIQKKQVTKKKRPQEKIIEKDEYVDRKTGHIYLKDTTEQIPQHSPIDTLSVIAKEKIFDLKCWTQKNFKNIKRKSFSNTQQDFEHEAPKRTEKTSSIKKQARKKDSKKTHQSTIKTSHQEQDHINKSNSLLETKKESEEEVITPIHPNDIAEKKPVFDFENIISSITPNFHKLKQAYARMNQKQRVYLFAALAIIVITPLLINNTKDKKEKEVPLAMQEVRGISTQDDSREKLSQEKSIQFITNEKTIFSSDVLGSRELDAIKFIDEELFLVSEKKVVVFENGEIKKEFLFPEEFSKAKLVTYMDSLSLFFILTDENQLLAFNSKSKRFQHNVIDFPENSEITTMGAYMTYLYAIDENAEQIYRYPRADGGFGEKTIWLKENADLKNTAHMAVDGKIILLSKDKKPQTFFKSYLEEFSFESPIVPMSFDRISATTEMKEIFIMDKTNSRIIQFDENGKIQQQFHNKNISDAKDFTFDTDGNILILTSTKILKLEK